MPSVGIQNGHNSMRNLYQAQANRGQYTYGMNGMARVNPFNAPNYTSMAAQFGNLNPTSNVPMRTDNLNFQDHMLHYQSY